MAYTVNWGNNAQTIIVTTLHEGWAWDDLGVESTAEECALLDAVAHPVVVIMNFEGRLPPLKSGWSRTIATNNSLEHPNAVYAVVVQGSRLASGLVDVYNKLFGAHSSQIGTAPTLGEAFELAERMLTEHHCSV